MAKKFFVLGIGGTGMRCIESLIHLCAMGMFDDTDVHMLALDTDINNGNFSRLKEVKDAYMKTKNTNPTNSIASKDTYFSANLKYYQFSPNYDGNSTFDSVFDYISTKNKNPLETEIADLMFTDDVENFNLQHGYRAQTHLGSMMMYQSIIEEAKKNTNNDLKSFLTELTNAAQQANPHVFILGSVFGGTGASSIPIIPQAIAKAAGIVSNGAVNIADSAYFGSTLLTAYFNFKAPSQSELSKEKVIASSQKFALNSQVAMMFYDNDTTVKNTYQKFYMLGTEGMDYDPMAKDKEKITETITGGENQKNDSHYIELMAACAALDFCNTDDAKLKEIKDKSDIKYLYRSCNDTGKLEFQDFVGSDDALTFAKKFGTLIAFSLLCNGDADFISGLQDKRQGIGGFEDVDLSQISSLKHYFELFHVKFNSDGTMEDGWLRQLYRSAGQNFLFNNDLFSPTSKKEMMKFDWSKSLYAKDGITKGKECGGLLGGMFSNKFNSFKEKFQEVMNGSQLQATNKCEQVLKLMYDTLCALYKF